MKLHAAERRYGQVVVGPIDLVVPSGCAFGLVGSNGAGKTTLLRLVTGLLEPSSGLVEVWDRPVIPGVRPADLGAIIEEPAFYPWLSAHENLTMAAAGRAHWEKRIPEVLELVGLAARGHARVAELSQGMRQRLGLARVLLGDPRLLILDEPTNGLDPQGIRWMRERLRALVDQGKTVLLSSHLLGEVQLICDAIAVIAAGKLLASGTVDEIAPSSTSLEELYFQLIES